VLTRTFYITLDLIHVQEEYAKLKSGSAGSETKGSGADKDKIIASKDKEIAELKKKGRDFDTLKNQAASQAAEYDRLADRYNKLSGQKPGDKKAD
ncbi:hypothetical protein K435DRAFT_962361, partial [Dendrothele bispora CBS 962.96]